MTLTREQLEQMTDDELDAVVATVVMHYVTHERNRFGPVWETKDGGRFSHWSPSTSWSAMGEVVVRLAEMRLLVTIITGNVGTDVQIKGEGFGVWSYAEETPRAVAIAAVLAVQEMKP